MTITDRIAQALCATGYDVLTANEYARSMVREIIARPPGNYTVHAGDVAITIRRA